MLTFQRCLSRSVKQIRFFANTSVLSSENENKDNENETEKGSKNGRKLSKEEANTKLNDLLQMMLKKEEEKPVSDVKVTQAKKPEIIKPVKEKPLGEKLADAAKDVATSLGGDIQQTESELLQVLLKRSEPGTQILKDVLTGMKVQKTPAEQESRAKQVRDTLSRQPLAASISAQMRTEKYRAKQVPRAQVDILGAEPSAYFTGLEPVPPPCELRTWDSCVQKDLRLATTHPPSNIYEQMIQWTDRGMLWHFPIDNEQGLAEEKKVSFEEHIFLERHLEGWCPERGPVRHFMELVCVGLSKNHWLSAEEKRNHIYWFREYFEDKKELLKEIGAGTITIEAGENKEEATQ